MELARASVLRIERPIQYHWVSVYQIEPQMAVVAPEARAAAFSESSKNLPKLTQNRIYKRWLGISTMMNAPSKNLSRAVTCPVRNQNSCRALRSRTGKEEESPHRQSRQQHPLPPEQAQGSNVVLERSPPIQAFSRLFREMGNICPV